MVRKKPVDLGELLDQRIVVNLKGGPKLQGTLVEHDDYMNLVLNKVKEYRPGKPPKKHELVVVKGGNVREIVG